METHSELLRENKELTDRKELLELRQENRKLKRQVQQLEGGKSAKIMSLPELTILIVTLVCITVVIASTAGWV